MTSIIRKKKFDTKYPHFSEVLQKRQGFKNVSQTSKFSYIINKSLQDL